MLDTCGAIATFILPKYVHVTQDDAFLQEIVDRFLHC